MRRLLLAALAGIALLTSPAFGQTAEEQSRVASTRPVRVDVIDGDTIRRNGISIRVMGIDTPELRGRCDEEKALAIQARDRLAVIARRGVTIEVSPRRDRYGRVLAVVRDRSGTDVAQILIAEKLARPYTGRGQRQGWCGEAARS